MRRTFASMPACSITRASRNQHAALPKGNPRHNLHANPCGNRVKATYTGQQESQQPITNVSSRIHDLSGNKQRESANVKHAHTCTHPVVTAAVEILPTPTPPPRASASMAEMATEVAMAEIGSVRAPSSAGCCCCCFGLLRRRRHHPPSRRRCRRPRGSTPSRLSRGQRIKPKKWLLSCN